MCNVITRMDVNNAFKLKTAEGELAEPATAAVG